MRRLLPLLLAFSFASIAWSAPEKWTAAIDAYTKADALNPPSKGGVVFVGSSSIRLWDTLAQDFPGVRVINRGFGGSEMADSVFYADRIVTAYEPKTVVVYAGENDINAGKSPETLHAAFNAFRSKVHAVLPKARIIFIGMKPSPSRWKLKENFQRGNALIAAECQKDPRLTFCDVWGVMLDAQGQPRPELFVKDMLHMKPEGYAIWTKQLAPLLK